MIVRNQDPDRHRNAHARLRGEPRAASAISQLWNPWHGRVCTAAGLLGLLSALLAPLARYLELIENEMDAEVLGPATLREIHYRLLTSPMGRMLRPQLAVESHASRIAKAIARMRADFRLPLRVADLAGAAGMSASSFHAHFRSVTGTTPLQYQKDLRLIEARSLLIDRGQSVSEAAYSVGYESPTHFSRDYSRKFGSPPGRDARKIAPAAHDRFARTT